MEETKETLLYSITGSQWKKIGIAPHHGINLPLSALHSENSCGIGEFFDLLPIIDWASRLKLDVIQLLPLNNSEIDPSPYNAISSCALNLVYLSLYALPYIDQLGELQKKLKDLHKLNDLKRIAYTEVLTHKLSWLQAYFEQVKEKIVKSKEFKDFVDDNPWVEPFALFKTLRERLGNTSWNSWPEEVRTYPPKEFDALIKRHWDEVSFYIAMQFLCYAQLKKVKAYANQKGIFLMGDIPIFVSMQSVDVWQFPEYFNTDLTAGAPPDYFAKEGQNWCLPLYQWDALRKNHFIWWKQRLRYAENFYDIFRIDHVLGFFRVWAIPPHLKGIDGHYVPQDDTKWELQGRELLSMICSSTTMLPIAEDLGVVPKMVRATIKEFGICGTKVIRWERKWDEDKRYIPLQYYPPISLTSVSTHDSETLTLWWKNFASDAKEFAAYKHWTYSPELTEKQREEILWDSHHTSSLFHINLLQEYFAFYPELSWPNPEDERINVPGTHIGSNWTYRFKPTVEEITSHQGLFSRMENIIFSPSPPATLHNNSGK